MQRGERQVWLLYNSFAADCRGMYSRLRTSLKQRKHGQRRTHRQRGGAAWNYISNTDRLTIWKTLIPKELEFVFKPAFSDNRKESASRYITLLERQDELFDFSVKAISAKINANLSDQADVIAKTTTNTDTTLFEFIDDIGNLIYFNAPAEDGTKKTKIQQIKKEKLIDLLLYPATVQNSFMQELANVCISIKSEPGILTDIKDSDDLKILRAKRYNTLAQANAYLTTGSPLRDGFFASQSIKDFDVAMATNRTSKETGFWNQFVFGIFDVNMDTINDRRTLSYGQLAAFVFQKYRDNTSPDTLKSDILKELSRKNMSETYTELKTNDSYRPDWSELTKDVVPGLTMLNVLQNISLEQLQFIVHLIYTIQKKEKEKEPTP